MMCATWPTKQHRGTNSGDDSGQVFRWCRLKAFKQALVVLENIRLLIPSAAALPVEKSRFWKRFKLQTKEAKIQEKLMVLPGISSCRESTQFLKCGTPDDHGGVPEYVFKESRL